MLHNLWFFVRTLWAFTFAYWRKMRGGESCHSVYITVTTRTQVEKWSQQIADEFLAGLQAPKPADDNEKLN